MSDSIVVRLRALAKVIHAPHATDAADAIEQRDATIATLTADLAAERAEVERLRADPTIYKHQCGHCSRLSPLPFLIPGYLLEARREQ